MPNSALQKGLGNNRHCCFRMVLLTVSNDELRLLLAAKGGMCIGARRVVPSSGFPREGGCWIIM